ncbi:lipase family alpha/beta hydrolase [Streptomyces europaeiscabiei]|uniref:lipase family alpha/beta hydrolase n=1 Tax=Streptomyces europaeiscabiei TaxID=146819 RepID=UPI0029B1D395|nr:alpha/beta fold hydrolase [Streptomyces europaeiscabiei]MDX3712265.1 alpha/beta fold hydrolase [Streptomyces europaeiscabiei]MDX3866385.1 alpha/beta fold hydrolase [Streptomyces europaeiscabiei]MDX3876112.1 alpha/beta fold hydrolase [Streptomyces europaeiscabiei]
MSIISNDTVAAFLTADTPQRLQMATDAASADTLRLLLGEAAFRELYMLAKSTPAAHLAPVGATIVFVPGVMGSVLASQGRSGVWWIDFRNLQRINDLRLADDGLSDIDPGFDVESVVVDHTYTGFFAAVSRQQDARFTCRGFHYDWRKPLDSSTDRLRASVLSARSANPTQRVHLVAHSMGGLLVRTTLMRYPELWQHVGKVVFLGTPHYGSPAIAGYLKNHLWGFDILAAIGLFLSRESFRSMWGVLSLLPAPAGVYPGTRDGEAASAHTQEGYEHPCVNFDLYSAAEWKLGLSQKQEQQLEMVLSAAAAHHKELHEWHLSLDRSQLDRMAFIAGVGYQTLFRVAYRRRFGFLWEQMDRVTRRIPGDKHREGDGRVPLASAELEDVGEARYAHAEHGTLPTVPAVYEDVLRFLSDEPMLLPSTAQAALQGHLASEQLTSDTPALAGTHPRKAGTRDDDPGYLDFTPPSAEAIAQTKEDLVHGRLPEITGLHIL